MILKYRAWYVLAEEMIDEILMISFVRQVSSKQKVKPRPTKLSQTQSQTILSG